MASKLGAFARLCWRSRWMGLVAGIWLLACSGNSYNFAIYSPALKATLQYNQKEINGIGAAKDIGDNAGIVSGMLFDYLPIWIVLVIGATQTFIGYISLWLVASGRVGPLPYWAMLLCMFMATNGNTWYNTAALVTCVRNFPRSRGIVVGMLKGFVGLSGAIFTQIYSSTVAPDQASFLFMVATSTASAGFIMTVVFTYVEKEPPRHPDSHQEEKLLFDLVLGSCICLAAFLMVSILVQDLASVPVPEYVNRSFTGGMFFFLLLPLVAPLWTAWEKLPMEIEQSQITARRAEEHLPSHAPSPERGRTQTGVTQPLLAASRPADEGAWGAGTKGKGPLGEPSSSVAAALTLIGAQVRSEVSRGASSGGTRPNRTETAVSPERSETDEVYRTLDSQTSLALSEGAIVLKKRRRGPRRGENFTLTEAWVKADFWLLFLAVLCGSGSGLTAINNLAQMAQAQGYSSCGIFVSLISIWNFLGRLGAGIISEHYVREYAISRPWFILASQGCMSVGHLLFASALPYSLHVGSLIVGLCYGAHWAIMPATVSELFGLQHFGSNYNFVAMSIPAGSFLFSGLLAGYLYDIEAAKDHPSHHHPLTIHLSSNGINANDTRFFVPPAVIPTLSQGFDFNSSSLLRGNDNTNGTTNGPQSIFSNKPLTTTVISEGRGQGGARGDWGRKLFHPAGGEEGPRPYTWRHIWRWLHDGGRGPSEALKRGPCRGAHCFRLTFIIMALVCFVGMTLAYILIRRTRVVYQALYKKVEEKRDIESRVVKN